jgi:hypothetical protein
VTSQYFAALPAESIVAELKARVDRYYRFLEETGRNDRMQTAYDHYYGNDGKKSAHKIQKSGRQGEFSLVKVNDYRNLVQHLLVMTTSSRPALECRATNTDAKSMSQAMLGNGLLEYYLREKRLERFLRTGVETSLVLDEGFLHLEWDTTLGDVIAGDGQETIREGDVKASVLTALDVIRDPYRSTPVQDWYILRIPVNKFDLAAKYSENAEHVLGLSIDAEQPSFVDYSQMEDTTEIYSYLFYHAKTAAMPDGRLVLFAGDACLMDVPLPYREIPVYRISAADVIGQIFGYSPGCDLLALQQITDALHSTVISNQLNFGVQSIIGPKGADIEVSQLGEGMTYFEVDPKYVDMIKALQLTKTPPEIFEYIQTVEKKMETLSGVNSVARGNPEASLESGAALALVQSMSIQFNSGLQSSYSQLLEDVGSGVIRMLQSFAKSPRVAAIAGRNSRYMLKQFTGADIDKISRVQVDVANPLSRTTSGRLQIAQDLLQNGLIKRPEQYLSVLSTGRLEPMYEDEIAELVTIQTENEFLSDGKPVPVVITDDHPAHVLRHKAVIANPEARLDPKILRATLQHIQEHIDQMQNADPRLIAMLGMQPLPPQAPPGPPGVPAAPGGPTSPAHVTDAENPVTQKAEKIKSPSMPQNPLSGKKFDPQTGGLPQAS